MIGSKFSFTPFTMICARYLFWFVNKLSILSKFMFRDVLSSKTKNSSGFLLSYGFLERSIFFTFNPVAYFLLFILVLTTISL